MLALNKGTAFLTELPARGKSHAEILDVVAAYKALGGEEWRQGKLSGCVYGADESVSQLVTQVFSKFAFANPLHPDVFPDVRKMEAEVIRMTLNLFNGDENACGSVRALTQLVTS